MSNNKSLAVAYSVNKHSRKKKPVQAADTEKRPMPEDTHHNKEQIDHSKKSKLSPIQGPSMVKSDVIKSAKIDALGHKIEERHKYAEGGEVEMDEHPESVVSAIMARRESMKAAIDDGMADIDQNNDEDPNMYYDLNEEALGDRIDEDFEDMSQPEDSNLMGDEAEQESENKLDKISAIRARMKSKGK